MKRANTEKVTKEQLAKEKGTAGDHGQTYEYMTAGLLYLRAFAKKEDFLIATNMEHCGTFDDIVYHCGSAQKKTYFIQLKSSANTTPLKNSDFLAKETANASNFSLSKYCKAFLRIKLDFDDKGKLPFDGSFKDCKFFLCTNNPVHRGLIENQQPLPQELKELFPGGSVLQFTKQNHPKIIDPLQNMPFYEEFLDHFYLIYDQTEYKIKKYIKNELENILNIPGDDQEQNVTIFVEEIKDWWRNKTTFLRNVWEDECPLRQTFLLLANARSRELSNFREVELRETNFSFHERIIEELRMNMADNQVVLIKTATFVTAITSAKVIEAVRNNSASLEDYCFCKMEDCVRHIQEITEAWKHLSFKVLIVEIQSSEKCFTNIYKEISTALGKDNTGRKVIFILQWRGNLEQNLIIDAIFQGVTTTDERFSFSDFTTETQNCLLDTGISFQGQTIPLSAIITKETIDSLKMQSINCESISQLLANEKVQLGSPLREPIGFYIDRKVVQKIYVNDAVFKESEVVFALSGSSVSDISSVIPEEHVCNLAQWDTKSTFKYVLVENETDFKAICNGHRNALWLHKRGKKWLFKQSQGDLEFVRSNLNSEISEMKPTHLLDGDSRIILIVAESGMGKSTLLTHLAHKTKTFCPEYWVVRMNINEYTIQLDKLKDQFEDTQAIKLLEAASGIERSNITLESDIFQHCYMTTGRMVVLIDGIDEVCPDYSQQVIEFIKFLLNTKIEKIWLTARTSIAGELENKIGVLCYSLVPFTSDDWGNFLIKFWESKNLEVQLCVDAAQGIHIPTSAEEGDFMGLPLHCLLLAEFIGRKVAENRLQESSSTSKIVSTEHITLVELYKSYIDSKNRIYVEEKKRSDLTNVNINKDEGILNEKLNDKYKKAALLVILQSKEIEELALLKLRDELDGFFAEIKNGHHKVGIILNVNGGMPVFAHRTFAEYYVAMYLKETLGGNKRFLRNHMLDTHLQFVRQMLDEMLTEGHTCILHRAVLKGDEHTIRGFLWQALEFDALGRTPLHLAVSYGLTNVTKLLLKYEGNMEVQDSIFEMTPLELASKLNVKNKWDVISEILEQKPATRKQYFTEERVNNIKDMTSLLTVAARNGQDDLLHYLVVRGLNVNIVLPGNSSLLKEAYRHGQEMTVEKLRYWEANGPEIPYRRQTELKGERRRGVKGLYSAENLRRNRWEMEVGHQQTLLQQQRRVTSEVLLLDYLSPSDAATSPAPLHCSPLSLSLALVTRAAGELSCRVQQPLVERGLPSA
ncbi:hypothetical protein C0J52_27831 [Blattella germanica]|nr:hypothetical protein C0J52_27831 [Blattella germanica]